MAQISADFKNGAAGEEEQTAKFRQLFSVLTGRSPLSWQKRLFKEHFMNGALPSIIDIPTGLGKTMVMAIWLIARSLNPKLPRRLVYVVDRRTVVDQATDIAEEMAFLLAPEDADEYQELAQRKPELAERKKENEAVLRGVRSSLQVHEAGLAVSTLRGQRADNQEWFRDLSRPAIIIGTVDLIGSGLLFSGYRSTFRRLPLEAGLLGQDSLLVLDEAHLSRPFEKLLQAVQSFQATRGDGGLPVQPMRVIRMTATSTTDSATGVFLLDGDLERRTGDFDDDTVCDRYIAPKSLRMTRLDEKDKLADKLAGEAIWLAEDGSVRGKRIVVFVRRPDDARAVADAIREHETESLDTSGPKPRKIKVHPYAGSVEVLTGTMRGLERDALLKQPVFRERWLNGDLKPDDQANQSPVFLVSTSAGEVGFDLNADHMVCDATSIDSLIQRLGRVNRRGLGRAQIRLFTKSAGKGADGQPKQLEGFELAVANTIGLLEGVTEVSPGHIADLRAGKWKDGYAAACSPDAPTVELTEILLDAWSMTSITNRMPGRPAVGPWLRGRDEGQAQTTIAWRAELELFREHPAPEEALRAVFNKHPIRPHESLRVNTGYLLEFLKRIPKLKNRPADLVSTRVAVRFPGGQVTCPTLEKLVKEPGMLFADTTLILPARFGGLDAAGMLDAESLPREREEGDPESPSCDEADHAGYEPYEGAAARLRVVIRRNESDEWAAHPVPGGAPLPESLGLEAAYARSSELISALTSRGLRLRLVQPVRFDDEGDPIESLVLLSPVWARNKPEDQALGEHIADVNNEATRMAAALDLSRAKSIRDALLYAAEWHDDGKNAAIWQSYANGPMPGGGAKGKSRRYRDPKSLNRTRHEFESLLRIMCPSRCALRDCVLPDDPETRDLALHLIAVHHGFGRPHFPEAFYRDFSEAERDAVHTDAVRRFARLQRKYGWWGLAWLESLLRCADAMASADEGAAGIEEPEGGAT